MKIYGRQGDLVIRKLDRTTGELTKATGVVFAGDSSGHRHRLEGTCRMRRQGLITEIEIKEPMQLVHEKSDGHKTMSLEPGIYSIGPLRERGDNQDRNVAD